MPRATTAACDVMPPRVVRIPTAAFMPAMSSGDVSSRTRIDRLALRRHRDGVLARSARRGRRPRRGRRAGPWPRSRPSLTAAAFSFVGKIGARSWTSCSGSTRATASSASIRPSSTMSVAIAHGGEARALAVARLEEVELVLLDRELEVLHVAEALLEELAHALQLGVGLRHRLLRARRPEPLAFKRPRRADAGDDVLALRVGQELAVEASSRPSTGSRVKATPVAEVSPRLPKTIAWTLTAVPQSSGMWWSLR